MNLSVKVNEWIVKVHKGGFWLWYTIISVTAWRVRHVGPCGQGPWSYNRPPVEGHRIPSKGKRQPVLTYRCRGDGDSTKLMMTEQRAVSPQQFITTCSLRVGWCIECYIMLPQPGTARKAETGLYRGGGESTMNKKPLEMQEGEELSTAWRPRVLSSRSVAQDHTGRNSPSLTSFRGAPQSSCPYFIWSYFTLSMFLA